MPLSHDEEERFAALEQAFYASDRRRARRIRRVTAAADAGVKPDQLRNRRWSVLGLVVGSVLVALFTVHVLLAVAGFVVLVVSGAYLAGQIGQAAARARQRAVDARARLLAGSVSDDE